MNKNLKTILIGAAILGGVIGVYFIGKGIKSKAEDKRKKKIKEDAGGGESTAAEEAEIELATSYNPSSDVKSLAKQIVGMNAYCRTKGVNKIVMPLNTPELKKLNSAWKKKYNKSLYRYLDDEWDNGVPNFANCYPEAMKKLSNVGLR